MQHWKTTLAGVGGALAGILATALQAVANGGSMDTNALINSLSVAAIGYLAADASQVKKG